MWTRDVHPLTGVAAIGYRRNGAPIWPVMGGSGPLGGGQQNGQQQGQQSGQGTGQGQGDPSQAGQQQGTAGAAAGGQQTGQQGQGGQQGQNPFGDLIGSAADQQGQQGAGQQFGGFGQQQTGQGQQGGGQQQGGQGQNLGGQAQGTLTLDQVNSLLDRRINQAFDTLANRFGGGQQNQGGQAGQGQQQGGGNQGQQGTGQPQSPAAPQQDQGAVREARLAFREYMGDHLRFVSETERQHAMLIGSSTIANHQGPIQDTDALGREVARQVSESIQGLRRHYQDTLIGELRRQGRLNETDQTRGGGSGPASGPGFNAQTGDKLAGKVANAQNMAAAINADRGHKPNNQTTGANAR